MKGLLQKDLSLMLGRTRSILILFLVGFIMTISAESDFVITYLATLTCVMAISTISYDEFDNGYPFIFCLPITRKDYVRSKYLFCFLSGVFGLLLGCILISLLNILMQKTNDFNILEIIISSIILIVLILSIMIPLQLKYGAEKSRIAIAIIAAVCTAIGYFGSNILSKIAPIDVSKIVLTDNQIMLIIGILTLLFLVISYFISVRIMKNKEF